jgi:hypothetical protein
MCHCSRTRGDDRRPATALGGLDGRQRTEVGAAHVLSRSHGVVQLANDVLSGPRCAGGVGSREGGKRQIDGGRCGRVVVSRQSGLGLGLGVVSPLSGNVALRAGHAATRPAPWIDLIVESQEISHTPHLLSRLPRPHHASHALFDASGAATRPLHAATHLLHSHTLTLVLVDIHASGRDLPSPSACA